MDVNRDCLLVVRGTPSPQEVAALTVVLLAAAAGPEEETGPRSPEPARWRRLERVAGFENPRTWQTTPARRSAALGGRQ